MRMRYVPLEEAHPAVRRPTETAVGAALLKAMEKATQTGGIRIPVPDAARSHLLATKRRHSFN